MVLRLGFLTLVTRVLNFVLVNNEKMTDA